MEEDDQEAGIFSWNVGDDVLYADTAVAFLFGLDPQETLAGLPGQRYLDRIHPDDRPATAALWSEAIQTGKPYHAEYRVTGLDGNERLVMAFGRCFRQPTGDPTHYAGIVHPVT